MGGINLKTIFCLRREMIYNISCWKENFVNTCKTINELLEDRYDLESDDFLLGHNSLSLRQKNQTDNILRVMENIDQ
jgi:hypothetical protein